MSKYQYLIDHVKEQGEGVFTKTQEQYLMACHKAGSANKAAKLLNKNRRTIDEAIKVIKRHAAIKGNQPSRDLTHKTADGFNAKRISTAYNKHGEVSLQWVIQEPEKISLKEKVKAIAEGLMDDLKGFKTPVPPPKPIAKDYLAMYMIGDHHFGMLADGDTKLDDADWDVKIATQVLINSIDRLTARSGHAHTGVLVNVGDFFHADSSKNETTNGTRVDVDTRIGKTYKLAGRLFQLLIDKMLKTHQQVVVINVRGNHDGDMAVHLSSHLELMYKKEKRVTVIENYSKFIQYQWQNNLFVYHHGDRIKHEQILQTVVKNLDEEWSKSKNRYCHLGHIHHNMKKEIGSMHFEHWGSLTAVDQWHSDSGYGAERSITVVTYHRLYGEDSRVKIKILEDSDCQK